MKRRTWTNMTTIDSGGSTRPRYQRYASDTTCGEQQLWDWTVENPVTKLILPLTLKTTTEQGPVKNNSSNVSSNKSNETRDKMRVVEQQRIAKRELKLPVCWPRSSDLFSVPSHLFANFAKCQTNRGLNKVYINAACSTIINVNKAGKPDGKQGRNNWVNGFLFTWHNASDVAALQLQGFSSPFSNQISWILPSGTANINQGQLQDRKQCRIQQHRSHYWILDGNQRHQVYLEHFN